jgi:hypothetical protein
MQRTVTGYLRTSRANGLRVAAKRLIAALALALILPVSTLAYTVVLRSGRRIEIPSSFSATRTTLTYEYAPGIYVTLQLFTVDAAATDRANNEPDGSFLRRIARQQQATPQQASNALRETRSPRTVTSEDLEASRRARQQSEEAYERRRIELGLPSREETARRREEEAQRAREQLRQSALEDVQSEAYWRERASALRAEIAATDGEINYLRARLAEFPDNFSTGSYTVLTTIAPLLPFGRGPFPHPFPRGPLPHPTFGGVTPGLFNRNITSGQITGRVGFGGGSTRGQVLINPPGTVTPFGQQLAATAFGLRRNLIGPVFPLTVYGTSFPYQYPSYDYEMLVARLDELAAHRAGLQARWRELEDEARRAGALPGWLR